MNRSYPVFLLLVLLALFPSCSNDDNVTPPTGIPIGDVTASVLVEVVGEDGGLIPNAIVNLGTESAMTDQFGIAFFRNIKVASSAYLTTTKDGYVAGSRRFYPAEGHTTQVRVMLLSDLITGQFDAGNGGTVTTFDGVVRLDFPAGVVEKQDGTPYDDLVSVSIVAIEADDPSLEYKMPGDLVGRTADDRLQYLESYGMANVELTSTTGEALVIKDGQKVHFTMRVPGDMLSGAPSTIPVWSFDEDEGLWIEEEEAQLNGDSYETELSHFSWWNLDVPYGLVNLSATFLMEGGTASRLQACVKDMDSGLELCKFLDDAGHVSGPVPANTPLRLRVKPECGGVLLHEQELGPLETDLTLPPVTLTEFALSATTISGIGVDCNGKPLENGYVRIRVGAESFYAECDPQDGSFSIQLFNCLGQDISVICVDLVANATSQPKVFPFSGSIDAGVITACDAIIDLVRINVPSLDTTYVWHTDFVSVSRGETVVSGRPSPNDPEAFIQISIDGEQVGEFVCSISMNAAHPESGFLFDGSSTAEITYFGLNGDWINGTFSGYLTRNPDGSGEQLPYTGEFSAFRY